MGGVITGRLAGALRATDRSQRLGATEVGGRSWSLLRLGTAIRRGAGHTIGARDDAGGRRTAGGRKQLAATPRAGLGRGRTRLTQRWSGLRDERPTPRRLGEVKSAASTIRRAPR